MRVERGRCGHVIRKVTAWGVAERSGLRDGDRLLEVNESFVDDIHHVEVRTTQTDSTMTFVNKYVHL